MSNKNFGQFTQESSPTTAQFVVGYNTAVSGGERRFALSDVLGLFRTQVFSTANGILQADGAGNVTSTGLTYSGSTLSVPAGFVVSGAGSIGLTAGGTNQNVTITPSGTGKAIIVGSINVSGGTSITSYANFNSGALSSTTSLNPGVLIYSGASSTSQYGMDLGYSGGYRLRLMAPNVISLALVTGAPPTTQSDFSEKFIFDLQNNIATISSIQSSGSSVIFTSPLTIAKASTGMQSSFSDYFGGYRATIQFKNPLDASIAGRGSGFGYVDNSGITRSLFATYTNDTSGTNFSSSFFVTGSDGVQRLTWSADGEGTNGLTLYGPKSGPVQVISTSVFKVNSTTDSTTAGAGSISTLGGVYATKKIISGTSVFDGTTASLAITGGAGNMTITAGTGNSRTLTLKTTTSGGTATNALVLSATQDATFGGSVTTSAPNGGTAGAWKMGILVSATVALDTTRYIQLDVGGTLYKLLVST